VTAGDAVSTYRIRELLESGLEPKEIVKMGFPKSTVYEVYHRWVKEKVELLEAVTKVLNANKLVLCLELGSGREFVCMYRGRKLRVSLTKVDTIKVAELNVG